MPGTNGFIIFFLNFNFLDCENLIRKMLVLDPSRRYNIDQVRKHKWLQSEIIPISSETDSAPSENLDEKQPNEHVLRIMEGLGIDTSKTRMVRSDISLQCNHRMANFFVNDGKHPSTIYITGFLITYFNL